MDKVCRSAGRIENYCLAPVNGLVLVHAFHNLCANISRSVSHTCDPPPRNESQCAKPTFAVARNLLQGCENVDFEILVVTA